MLAIEKIQLRLERSERNQTNPKLNSASNKPPQNSSNQSFNNTTNNYQQSTKIYIYINTQTASFL